MGEFGINPSLTLQQLFKERPYQGQDPEKASVLFLSSDANFDKSIESMPLFPKVAEYLQDGVAFWEKYSVHHPFMLSGYKADGGKFHKVFRKLDLEKSFAGNISFIELIDKPTYGNKNKSALIKMFTREHMERLEHWIFNSKQKRTLFIAKGVYKILLEERDKRFPTLFQAFKYMDIVENKVPLQLIYENKDSDLNVFAITHFSNSISNEHLKEIERTIKELHAANKK